MTGLPLTIVKLPVADMTDRERFLYYRMSGIGGSDVAAIMGLSKWKSAYQVWESKLGEVDDFDSEVMLWGRLQEPVIRNFYAAKNNVVVFEYDEPIRNLKYPELVANVDGKVAVDADATPHKALEIKTARYAGEWGDEDTDEIPYAYLLQVQHYLLVLGMQECDVAVLLAGSTYRQYTIQANSELQALIYEACRRFWHEHVLTGIAPAKTLSDLERMFGGSDAKGPVEVGAAVDRACRELAVIKYNMKLLEVQEAEQKEVIYEAFGTNGDTAISHNGEVLATWKLPKASVMVDSEKLESLYPQIYEKVLKDKAAARRLLLKIK